MMSIKLRVSRLCRKQELSVFLGAILSLILQEIRKSEAIGYTKPYVLKNPRFSRIGEFSECFNVNGKCVYEALQDTRLQRQKLMKVNRRKN
jgi:hypothetical protein